MDDGDGRDWSPAAADTAKASDPKDHKDPGDDTTAAAAASSGSGRDDRTIPVAAGTETAAKALPDPQPIGAAGASLATAAGKAVGGRLWPAGSATPPIGNPSTDENTSPLVQTARRPREARCRYAVPSPCTTRCGRSPNRCCTAWRGHFAGGDRKSIEAAVDPGVARAKCVGRPDGGVPMTGSNQADASVLRGLVRATGRSRGDGYLCGGDRFASRGNRRPRGESNRQAGRWHGWFLHRCGTSSPGQAAQATEFRHGVQGGKRSVKPTACVSCSGWSKRSIHERSRRDGPPQRTHPSWARCGWKSPSATATITARAETETPAAQPAVGQLAGVRERLAQQDIKVQHLNVDLTRRPRHRARRFADARSIGQIPLSRP